MAAQKRVPMPKVVTPLTDIAIKNLEIPAPDKRPNTVAVGGESGLLISVSPTGVKAWILRVVIGKDRREIRLGLYPKVSLKEAREKAREAKEKIRQGIDPVEERKAAKSALIAARFTGKTFEQIMTEYLEAKLADKDKETRKGWTNRLEKYAKPALGDLPIEEIDVHHVLRVIEPLWNNKTETAKRVRSYIEAILDYAVVKGYKKAGDNPARWKGNIEVILPAPSKITPVVNRAAIPIKEVQEWYAKLKKRQGIRAQALQFLTLTAARNTEAREAMWSEIDFENRLWVIPAARMKMRRDHRVCLSDEAIEILKTIPRIDGNPFIFSSTRGGTIAENAITDEMDAMHREDIAAGGKGWFDAQSGGKCVPHGLRSTFKDYFSERTNHEPEAVEMCLSHDVGSNVEKAYRRTDFLEKRRSIMQEWNKFLNGGK